MNFKKENRPEDLINKIVMLQMKLVLKKLFTIFYNYQNLKF